MISMSPSANYPRCSPGFSGNRVGKELTDGKITKYQKLGFYGEFKQKPKQKKNRATALQQLMQKLGV